MKTRRLTLMGFAWSALSPLREGLACSLNPVIAARTSTTIHFLGIATSDTVLTGAGALKYHSGTGHLGPAGNGPIFGQVVRVERVGGPWVGQLPSSTRELILVPWDYDASCRTVMWGNRWQWVVPATRGLFRGVLRDSSHWIGGRPTLDVFAPEFNPYPGRRAPGAALPLLTAEEALDFFEHLPDQALLESDPDSALRMVLAWTRAHPALASRWPVTWSVASIRGTANYRRLRMTPSPVTGTFRVVATLRGGDSLVFFSRTEQTAMSEVQSREPSRRQVGIYLMTVCTLRRESLPTRYSGAEPSCYHAVATEPMYESPDSIVWRGNIELNYLGRALNVRPAVDSQLKRLGVSREVRDPIWHYLPGRWVSYPNGRLRFEWGASESEAVVGIRAERVDTTVLIARPLR